LKQAAEAGLTPNGTILYGYSMGTAFAAHAAANSDPIAVVLEAPLSTFLAAVHQQVAYVPGFLVRTRFNNLARVKEIEAPVLLLAGGEDSVTPPAFAHALAAANPEFTTVKVVPGANHLNIIRSGGRAALAGFLSRFADHQKVITMPLKQS
jgi:pimeloyl-ACP methyl ester carboxylesterase